METLVQRKSCFLFGPRSTGKTTLLRTQFPENRIINLLESSTYLRLSGNPSLLSDMVRQQLTSQNVIVIDEIQKVPALLDEVHNLIETTPAKFILTGSSGRKLKRSGVNLLAGRAWQANLHPLVSREIDGFDIDRYLRFGGLPQVYGSQYPIEELDAYVNTYLNEEIQAEALVQNQNRFSRFLTIAALTNTEQVNYANIASDAALPASTVKSYFSILADTFTGFFLESWQDSKKRKAVATPKFYLFDVGVSRYITAKAAPLERGSSTFGKAFEHFIALELRAWISYTRTKVELRFWRTRSGTEVDFLVGDFMAVEVKSTSSVKNRDFKGLQALAEEERFSHLLLVSFDEHDHKRTDGITALHWKTFLTKLWNNEFSPA